MLEKKPDYLVIHLITSLPLILFLIFKFDTKLILRISGLPKLNIFRKFLWKISNNKIHFVTVPTKETCLKLKNMNIFDNSKIRHLPDPVFIENKIKKKLQLIKIKIVNIFSVLEDLQNKKIKKL